jgi:hypothetical protein
MNGNKVTAVFDDRASAERALSELRTAGISDSAISLLGRPDDAIEGGADHDEDGASKGSVIASVAGGGVAGAILGVAALAIPGVGPLAAAGAIAASAVPTGAAVGAAVGATGGAIARMLTDHDVDGRDAEYYEGRIQSGGTFVSVDTSNADLDADRVQDILQRNGGHTAPQSGTESGLLDGHNAPEGGAIDRLSHSLDGADDPNRGPLDRTANAIDSTDDPDRGPLDRTANALDGNDDPSRGPVDRVRNTLD